MAQRRYRWRLVGVNGRALGVSAVEFESLELCLDHITRLSALLPDAKVIKRRETNRSLLWVVVIHGEEMAHAPKSYSRIVDTDNSAERFLCTAGRAFVDARMVALDQVQRRYRPHQHHREEDPVTEAASQAPGDEVPG